MTQRYTGFNPLCRPRMGHLLGPASWFAAAEVQPRCCQTFPPGLRALALILIESTSAYREFNARLSMSRPLAGSLSDNGRGVARVCVAGFGVPGDCPFDAESEKLGKHHRWQLTGEVDQRRVAREARWYADAPEPHAHLAG